jgi:hypothetical protein
VPSSYVRGPSQYKLWEAKSKSSQKTISPKLQTADFLPLSAPAKRFRYVKEIETLGLFRLLLIEMWHGGDIFKNQVQEGVLRKRVENYTYKAWGLAYIKGC